MIHDGSAAAAQLRTVLDHAGGDLRDVGDFGAAQAERVAGAHLLRLGAEGEALTRRQRGQLGGESQDQTGLADSAGEGCGHVRLPLAALQRASF